MAHLTDEQRTHLEERLLDERRRAQEEIDRRTRDLADDDGEEYQEFSNHPADEASDTQERDKDRYMADRASRRLAEIDDALRRLRDDPDAYGVSEISGETIAFERLDTVPWTRRTAAEAQAAEDEGADERVPT